MIAMTRAAKAASGLLPRHGLLRLLAAAAMALAWRAGAVPLWAWAASRQALRADGSGDVLVFCAALWCLACVIASFAACLAGEGADARRRATGEAPFVLWGRLTRDGRVTAWRALAWILLWPAEPLACLWVALWWLGAAMNLTIHRRGGGT